MTYGMGQSVQSRFYFYYTWRPTTCKHFMVCNLELWQLCRISICSNGRLHHTPRNLDFVETPKNIDLVHVYGQSNNENVSLINKIANNQLYVSDLWVQWLTLYTKCSVCRLTTSIHRMQPRSESIVEPTDGSSELTECRWEDTCIWPIRKWLS